MHRTGQRLAKIAPGPVAAPALAIALLIGPGLIAPAPLAAREALGIFQHWGAFRDAGPAPRCFAIAQPLGHVAAGARWRPFAAIGYWPRQNLRGQVNIRLSQELAPGSVATLVVGTQHFALAGGHADVWAKDRRDDAAIVAALRAGGTMSVRGRAGTGTGFSDRYELRGAATAIDAAALGCARLR